MSAGAGATQPATRQHEQFKEENGMTLTTWILIFWVIIVARIIGVTYNKKSR